MANSVAEAVIGAVVLVAAAGFALYAGQTSGHGFGSAEKPLRADFRDANGISVGTDVRVAGIKVGSVTALVLDPKTYQAQATFTVPTDLDVPDDSDVKIASEGLLGGNYLDIQPGASETMLAAGDQVLNTQGSIDLLNLLMRFGTGSSK
ncbi:outer membrane lipid asymmetry maintenance protein MlaD [Amaricoccus solimangrovi]|uniref:Outer membrane lipid asymmetry maintenance protein MlaD n=1 Tax=Amaricoccus solimangrovi TaxID=2589815 RepID=A0A501WLF3_9RHOB|nr:outer membrane lipid asymmetry maintenance protein MlaD [Amaricoccus solimangrovi]TPE49230.1 outer membrane lipid asymmetry maintenance protein MlaD [Amaricoccus solimangrovi]